MVDALLGRGRHYCHTAIISGPSLHDPRAEVSVMEQREYVQRLLDPYRATPGATGMVRRPDRLFAVQLHERAVPLDVAENALTLAVARRLARPATLLRWA